MDKKGHAMEHDNKMLNDCTYDAITLLKKISCTMWFIKKHALEEAQSQKNSECATLYENLYKDLEKYIEPLKKELCKSCEK